MTPNTTLAFAGITHKTVKEHLFPGDGNEAAAVLLCAASPGPRDRLIVRGAILVPHAACKRYPDLITWPGTYIEDAIDATEEEGLTIILLHSHPGGWLDFSTVDNQSDARVLPGLFEAFGTRHGSAIMTPDGAIRARLYDRSLAPRLVDLVTVSGDDIRYFWNNAIVNGRLQPRPLAFTGGMTRELSALSAAIIGVSGTGSIMAEQAARFGFGKVILVDFDIIENKNLNRILNSTLDDATSGCAKVEMFAAAIESHRGAAVAVPINATINSREAVIAVGQCDVIFSCVDSLEGRQILDSMSAAFLTPLFDVGVTIPTHDDDGVIEIIDVCGRVDYIQPGGSSLGDRGVYTQEGIRAEFLRANHPEQFREELADGYIKGVTEEAPSVISLNMRAAAALANEYLSRVYAIRQVPNRQYARTMFSLSDCEETFSSEDAFSPEQTDLFGRGSREPLLALPSLSIPRKAAA